MSDARTRTHIRAWSAGVGMVALLAVAALPAAAQTPITKMAYISPELVNDGGWNQQGWEAAQSAGTAIGAEVIKADNQGYPDLTPILGGLVDDGAQFIIAQAGGYSTQAAQFANDNNVPVVVYDRPELLKANLVGDIATDSQEGGYLAGVLAATMTQTGTLGIVISADDTNWHKQSGGFIAGALATNPDIKFANLQVSASGYADAPGGKATTTQVIASGADIVFGMGDGSSFGMLDAVENATPPAGADKVWFIDDIGDKSDPAMDSNGVVLSSVLWNFQGAFDESLAEIAAGTFGTAVYTLDLANGGISLLQTPNITPEAWTAVQAAQAGISDGTIVVPVTPTQADVDALLPAS